MSGCDIRLVFPFPPKYSTLQYKKCAHLWNNFPCIKFKDDLKFMIIDWVTKDTSLSCRESEYQETDRMNSYSRLRSLILCGYPCMLHWRAQNKSCRTYKLSISSSNKTSTKMHWSAYISIQWRQLFYFSFGGWQHFYQLQVYN